jgi:hypothetical protein
MTSACSRWSQPVIAAISNWNGGTPAVYAMVADLFMGHYASTADTSTPVLHVGVEPAAVKAGVPKTTRTRPG